MANWIPVNSLDSFTVGEESFSDLEIHPTAGNDSFYYFFNKKKRTLVGDFILDRRP